MGFLRKLTIENPWFSQALTLWKMNYDWHINNQNNRLFGFYRKFEFLYDRFQQSFVYIKNTYFFKEIRILKKLRILHLNEMEGAHFHAK